MIKETASVRSLADHEFASDSLLRFSFTLNDVGIQGAPDYVLDRNFISRLTEDGSY